MKRSFTLVGRPGEDALGGGGLDELDVAHSVQQLVGRRLDLDLGQHRADAEVPAEREPGVVGRRGERRREVQVGPGNVERVGVAVLARVAVGRRDQADDGGSGGDGATGQLDVLRRLSHDHLDRRRVAQGLGEGVRDLAAVRADHGQLLRVLEQVPHHVGHGLVGGLATGDQEQADERLDLQVGHLLAVDLGGAERRQQVVARVGAALGDLREQVLLELVLGLQPRRHHIRVLGEVPQEGHDRVVPTVEQLVVGLRQGQHVDDDVDREARRELVDQVDLAVVTEAVDQLAGVLLDDRDELLGELAAPEGRRHQTSVDGVLAAVHLQDRAAVDRFELPAVVVAGEAAVLERLLDIRVATDHVGLHTLVEVQGVLLAEHPPGLIGIGGGFGREDVGAGHGWSLPWRDDVTRITMKLFCGTVPVHHPRVPVADSARHGDNAYTSIPPLTACRAVPWW